MGDRAGSVDRLARPLFQVGGGGSIPTPALMARDLVFDRCNISHAVCLVRAWHSRLPHCQNGPWQFAFSAEHCGITYAVALWHNPSGRCIPQHWLELRRMACAPDAPRNTASRFLAWMVRWFKQHHSNRERAISYQDTSVHFGTIYKASGWLIDRVSKARVRDRSKPRRGTKRMYRTNANGVDVDGSQKVRWSISLT